MKKNVLLSTVLCLAIAACAACLSGCGVQKAPAQDRAAQIEQFKSPDQRPGLQGARVGVMEGSTSEQLLNAQYPDTQVFVFKSNSDAVAALRADKVDYVMLADPEAINYERYSDDLFYCTSTYLTEGHGVSVNKKKPELRDSISKVIDAYHADGTLDEIKMHWFVDKDSPYVVEEPPARDSGPVLKVAITTTREPLAFIMNGAPQGLCIELIKRIAYDLNMQVEFSDMDFAGSLAAVTSGKCDVALATAITDERKKSVDFTNAYMDIHHVILAKIDGAVEEKNLVARVGDKLEQTFVIENRWKLIVSGFGVTLLISLSSLILGSAIGCGLCALKLSRRKALNKIAGVYGRIMQGLPVLIILMMLYYVLFARVEISAILVAVIAFSLTFASGASEVFKTGIAVVAKGQIEAALASGFTSAQAFVLITLPQAARTILPVYTGEFITMLKLTSIVGYISIQDLTKASDIIRSRTYEAFFPLIVIALIYFMMIFAFAEMMKRLERKLDPLRRNRIVKGEPSHD